MPTPPKPATPDLHHITILSSGNFRVRVHIKGKWFGSTHDDVDFALAERDGLLARVLKTRKPWDIKEKERQKKLLPPFTSLHNICWSKYGCYVKLGRHYADVYGGHFSGPDAIAQAVARRDALEIEHPAQQ